MRQGGKHIYQRDPADAWPLFMPISVTLVHFYLNEIPVYYYYIFILHLAIFN